MRRLLIVVAHPDDEVLGAGAIISKFSREGEKVSVLILTNTCKTRDEQDLVGICKASYAQEGLNVEISSPNYLCMTLGQVEHYALVKCIEDKIREVKPDIVITHHPSDLNPDHQITAQACMEAIRLPQRKIKGEEEYDIKALYYLEVPSSTDWGTNKSLNLFKADVFEEVEVIDYKNKIKLLEHYKEVIREYPHPRSKKALLAKLIVNGVQSGYKLAEGLQNSFRKGI